MPEITADTWALMATDKKRPLAMLMGLSLQPARGFSLESELQETGLLWTARWKDTLRQKSNRDKEHKLATIMDT